MEMKDLKILFGAILGKATSKEDISALKALTVKMEAMAGIPADGPPAPEGLKTKDGKVLTVEGELKNGSTIMEITPTGPAPAEGSFELADGTIVVAVGGKVTEYKPVEAVAPITPPQIEAAVTTQMSAHKKALDNEYAAKFSAQEDRIKTLLEATNLNSKMLTQILEAPIETIEFAKQASQVDFSKALTEDEYKKLSNHQKLQYNKIHKK